MHEEHFIKCKILNQCELLLTRTEVIKYFNVSFFYVILYKYCMIQY